MLAYVAHMQFYAKIQCPIVTSGRENTSGRKYIYLSTVKDKFEVLVLYWTNSIFLLLYTSTTLHLKGNYIYFIAIVTLQINIKPVVPNWIGF